MFITLYKNSYLLKQLVKKDIMQRYQGSVLGMLWSFIVPILMLIIYTFVFSEVFQARWNMQLYAVAIRMDGSRCWSVMIQMLSFYRRTYPSGAICGFLIRYAYLECRLFPCVKSPICHEALLIWR